MPPSFKGRQTWLVVITIETYMRLWTGRTLLSLDMDTTFDKQTLASEDSTSDTLTRAKLDRENQGPWEAEYSYSGEADLHGQWTSCDKNPGHKNFIPVDKFSIEDLPEDFRHKDVFEYIRAESELTVRVKAKNVSGRITLGTGFVKFVQMNNRNEAGPCRCNECRNSSTRVIDYAGIIIQTASHVASEDHDGELITCHLFFDRGNTPDTCSGVVTLTGTSVYFSDGNRGICNIECISHDLDLARRLQQTLTRSLKLRLDCYKLVRDDRQPLLFIVSHPHGCSKQVSLGTWISADMLNSVRVSALYNTATCRGSSGASVCALPEVLADSLLHGASGGAWPLEDGVHWGSYDLQPEINFCRSNIGAPVATLISLHMLPLDKGSLEDFFCLMEDDDTNKQYAACKRNPGHQHFRPLENLSVDNLPPVIERDEIMEYIKLVADLTVRVTVNYVSEERPETVRSTDIPYPWFSKRGSNLMRVGSGWVNNIESYNDQDCHCKECQKSPKPRRQFALISINTATHLVYDQMEAEHTTCDLFFDSGVTPDACKDVVTLTDMDTFYKSPVCDTCIIKYYTHDMDLARRLECMTTRYTTYFDALNRCDDVKSTESLTIVVSHPHGCAKQVSIHRCDVPVNACTEKSQRSFGNIVCPGSSGALVYVLFR